jgi:hypothetical protein
VLEFFEGKIGEVYMECNVVCVAKLKHSYHSFVKLLRAFISGQFQNHGMNDLIPPINKTQVYEDGV